MCQTWDEHELKWDDMHKPCVNHVSNMCVPFVKYTL
jgi:hypothetical protein